MKKTNLAIFAIFSILFSATIIPNSYAGWIQAREDADNHIPQAIPDWIKTQFAWYVNGEIDEKTLLISMNWMFDNNLMHLSQDAANEVKDLREVNSRLHYGISSYIEEGQIDEDEFEVLSGIDVEPIPAAIAIPNLLDARKSGNESATGDFGSIATGDINNLTTEAALNHLRKAYDLNPNLQTVVLQYDKENDKWTAVMNVEWHTSSTQQGDVLSPTIIQEDTFVFPHLLENSGSSASSSSSESSSNTYAITYTGLEFARSTVDDIMRKGGTTAAWEEGITSFDKTATDESVADELQGIVVLCNIEIDKKAQTIDAELYMIEKWLEFIEDMGEGDATRLATGETASKVQHNQSDLEFIQSKLEGIDLQIKGLSNGIKVLDEKLATAGDDAQLANIDLQNSLQKQQQTLQTMSNVSKMLHDTTMSIIRNMG